MFQISVITSIILGAFSGYLFPEFCYYLKPLGNFFINLILTAIVPFIFFSVASIISDNSNSKQLNKIFASAIITFLVCSAIAAIEAILATTFFCLLTDQTISANIIDKKENLDSSAFPQQIISFSNINLIDLLSVKKFSDLLSHEHVLALILFSILIGFAARKSDFCKFLMAGNKVTTHLFKIIMYFSPIGFFSYFSVLVHSIEKQFITSYIGITSLYYVFCSLYFVINYSLYAFVADKKRGVCQFWKYISNSLTTSLATCSSIASIPSNFKTAKLIGIEQNIYKTCIPIGAIIHKQGSVIGSVFKIIFLLKIYHFDFLSLNTWITVVFVSMLTGIIVGAFPGGGMLGEIFIISIYGFDPSALLIISTISILIDPMATMLNVAGNITTAMLIERIKNFDKLFCIFNNKKNKYVPDRI